MGVGVRKEEGGQAHPAEAQQIERPGMKNEYCPKELIPDSSLKFHIHSSGNHVDSAFKVYPKSFSPLPPGAANGWGWARSTERIEKKFTPPERWGYDPVDPASLPRSLEQARLPEEGGGGYQGRKGRKGVPGRGNSMTKDAEKRRPSVWLQWSDKWEEMQVEAGEAGRGQLLQSQTPA